jgi:malonate decarboxylase epsilon subunit
VVHATLQEAESVLGESLDKLDTPGALQSTRNVQLCLLIAGVAGARLLMADAPSPDFVAGLSIGAYPAAVIAQALSFADALTLVEQRGRLMQEAFPSGYGMLALLGLQRHEADGLIEAVATQAAPVFLANVNAEQQFVAAGAVSALDELAKRVRASGTGTTRRLTISVPSHCPLLNEPAQQLANAFSNITVNRPSIRYLSGSSARLVMDPQRLADDLALNMCRTVEWHATLQNAQERGVRLAIELAPGTVLTALAKRVFIPGTAIALQDNRIDTICALLREEARQDR